MCYNTLKYILTRKGGYSFVQCYIREYVVGISSVEVVPFLLVTSLSWEHAEMVQLLLVEIHNIFS